MNAKATVGVWHNFFTAKGIQSFLSDSERFQFVWMESRNPLQRVTGSPVNILVTAREADPYLGTSVRELSSIKNAPSVIVTAAVKFFPREALCLKRLGVKGFVRMPQHESDTRTFLTALAAIVKGNTFYDPSVVDPRWFNGYEDPLKMTVRETEIAMLVANGLCTKEIANRLNVAGATVDVHRSSLMRKLEIHNAVELCRYMMFRASADECLESVAYPDLEQMTAPV